VLPTLALLAVSRFIPGQARVYEVSFVFTARAVTIKAIFRDPLSIARADAELSTATLAASLSVR